MPTGGVLKITDLERDRYSRLRLIPWWEQERLADASILVAGIGALGNEVAKNLAQLGVGSLFLVDFDYVETSNLTRSVLFREEDEGQRKVDAAAVRISEINPDVCIHPFHGDAIWDVGLGVFRRMDVVIGCLDNREARLAINRACWKLSKPWVNGAIQELMGTAEVFVPPGACYECNFTEMDYRLINLRYSCPLLKREDIITGKIPTVPTISSIIGGLQVQEALKILHGMGAGGVGYTFVGMTNNFFTSEYSRNERCMSHETYGRIVELNETSKKLTPRELIEIDGKANSERGVVELDREIVSGFTCKKCGRKCDIMKPLGKVTMNEGTCKNCGSLMDVKMTHTIRADDKMADTTLAEIGLPLLHIIAVRNGRSYNYYEVSGDEKKVFKKREVR